MIHPLLVDSSWYIAQAKKGFDPLKQLAQVSHIRDIAVCGMIMSEVGRGLKYPKWLTQFENAWREMFYIESTQTVWQVTLEIAWALDRSGKVLSLQDVHIAACARTASAVILSYDQHFQQIPGVKVVQDLY
ncbi:PIN domain-containing protein [Kiritimatiellota bacterium B12222]|nr:PIN domain-containing protein [Kiritimatiellota bacterium B12222]